MKFFDRLSAKLSNPCLAFDIARASHYGSQASSDFLRSIRSRLKQYSPKRQEDFLHHCTPFHRKR